MAAGGKMGMTCLASMLAQTLGVLFCLSGKLPLTAEMEQSQLHIMRLTYLRKVTDFITLCTHWQASVYSGARRGKNLKNDMRA